MRREATAMNHLAKRGALLLLSTGLSASAGNAAEDAPAAAQRSAYFGDLHIHTMYSHDAFRGGVRTTPDDAYRYAKGEAIDHPSGERVRLSGPPLDFLAVTDHAEFLGAMRAMLDPASDTFDHPDKARILPVSSNYNAALRQLAREDSAVLGKAVISDAWQRGIDAAERHNQPGTFTTLIGYEYTPGVGGRHVHRNVIFRSAKVPALPFSARDSADPRDLWHWLDRQRADGIEALAIPHNMNQSDGLAFMETTWQGEPVDRAFAEQRLRNEPIAEISQKKGTSEVHPLLSPNDEWADFQIVQYYLKRRENKDPISVFKGGYWRDALNTGLVFAERLGVNPFQLGAVAASDSHVSAGSYEEDAFFANRRNTPRTRGSAYGPDQDGWEGFWTPRQATHGTGGLAGIWADANTRAALFDAMRRRETFATSGPRIRVRLFAGFALGAHVAAAADAVAAGYAHGVAMGSVLNGTAADTAPDFLIWAMRDPNSGWLQRAQIVKGWIADGEPREQVFDVACSDGLAPDPRTHRCPDNGARVNPADCSISRDTGAVELRAVWTDPAFDRRQRSYYYLRVLENPSCRWSTWDALRLDIAPNPALPATHQERAWSSPIWFDPAS